MTRSAFHERLAHAAPRRGSDRNLGLTFAVVGGLAAGLSLWRGTGHPWIWSGVAAAFLLVAIARPSLLGPLNVAWHKLGLAMGKVVGPVVMVAVYVATVVPTGLVLRAAGRDPLRLKWDRAAPTYWVKRAPPGPNPETMSQQF